MSIQSIPRSFIQVHELGKLLAQDDCLVFYEENIAIDMPIPSPLFHQCPVNSEARSIYLASHRFVFVNLSFEPDLKRDPEFLRILQEKGLTPCQCDLSKQSFQLTECVQKIFFDVVINILSKTIFKNKPFKQEIDFEKEFAPYTEEMNKLEMISWNRSKWVSRGNIACCPVATTLQIASRSIYCVTACLCNVKEEDWGFDSNPFEACRPVKKWQFCCLPLLNIGPSACTLCDSNYDSPGMDRKKEFLLPPEKQKMEDLATNIQRLQRQSLLQPLVQALNYQSGLVDNVLQYLHRHPMAKELGFSLKNE